MYGSLLSRPRRWTTTLSPSDAARVLHHDFSGTHFNGTITEQELRDGRELRLAYDDNLVTDPVLTIRRGAGQATTDIRFRPRFRMSTVILAFLVAPQAFWWRIPDSEIWLGWLVARLMLTTIGALAFTTGLIALIKFYDLVLTRRNADFRTLDSRVDYLFRRPPEGPSHAEDLLAWLKKHRP